VQGSAADIVKEAMRRCSKQLRRSRVPARLCAQIHDELLWEVSEGALRAAAELIQHCMENMRTLDEEGLALPPLPVCVVAGHSWGDMRAVECSS
jgi:DNA polymerase I